MATLGTVLDETQPDVIVFLGSDHVETFSVTCIPSFAIIAGSRAIGRLRKSPAIERQGLVSTQDQAPAIEPRDCRCLLTGEQCGDRDRRHALGA